MAGTGLRLSPPSSSAAQKLVLLLTALPMALASLAFLLQWRGGLRDPSSPWPIDRQTFPGVDSSTSSPAGSTPVLPPSSSVDCSQILLPLPSPSFPYFRARNFHDDRDDLSPKIVITTSTSAGLEQTLPWIFYHKILGVRTFFLFVEGKAAKPQNVAVLETIPGVKVVYRTKDLEEQQAKSRIWNETWLANFFYKPCNYELFVKQTLNMEMAIVMARDAGMDWIIHLDTDELMHPAGARDYSVRQLLSEVPENVDIVIFPNYESCIERDDIKDPFSEVSLFKKNYDHLLKETYFGNYKEATRGNPNYFLTYGNGKSAARVQSHLRPNGAHRWHNYMKTPNEVKLEEAAVLHFTYTKFSDLTSRRDRCGCKPTKEDTKRCFMLDFDKNAFIIASTVTEQEMFQWYRERVVWTDQQLKIKLLKKGILTRIYAPMTIIDNLRESGIFSSAIASAKAPSTGKTSEFLQNSTGADSPLLITAPRITNRKLGRNETQAASRRVLWAESGHLPAVPPLSPPSFDDL